MSTVFRERLKGITVVRRADAEEVRADSAALGVSGELAEVNSSIISPIMKGDASIGAIIVSHFEDGREFGPEQERLLGAFARQLAAAVGSARRYLEERDTKSVFERMIEDSPVSAMVIDAASHTVLFRNQAARRMFGELPLLSVAGSSGSETLTLSRPDGREVQPGDTPIERAAASGQLVEAEEFSVRVPGGADVAILMSATPLREQDGSFRSVLATMQDMTPLQELEQMRSEFMGMVSHELSGPLTSIKSCASALLNPAIELEPDEIQQFLSMIDERADLMRGLIDELLDLARVETSTMSVAPEPVRVDTLLEQARHAFLSSGASQTIEVDVPIVPPTVMADRHRILQVLDNLLAVASRNSDDGGLVEIRAVRKGNVAEIEVRDQGAGTEPALLPHLFRKFSRIEKGDDTRGLGESGVRLAICEGIIEAHGGRIWAESDGPRLGTSFMFTLPLGSAVAMTDFGRPRERVRSAGRPRAKVLVVDHDPQALHHARRVLADDGYAPIVTQDPGEVERLIEVQRPDLALIGLMLPGLSAIDLIQQLPGLRGIPVIVMSAYGQEQYITTAFEGGAADYIVKPYSQTELLARVGAALRDTTAAVGVEALAPFQTSRVTIDYAARLVYVDGNGIHLSTTEFRLLTELSQNAGRVLTHEQILDRVWGGSHSGDVRLIRSVVNRIRRKLGEEGKDDSCIQTVPGVGYRIAQD